uniref:McrB family protein n=1 Tax=Pedobacter sp. TaxID=1411316 RepID=UPI00159904B4|nr:AAA family ATPase [Pedobacter sp.]QJS06267.1 type II RM system restriction subunit [Pedobacter sp.]
MKVINDKSQFDSVIASLKQAFPAINDNTKFKWQNMVAVMMLNIKKNWTTDSSNGNYQINSNDVKDFFPVLQISEAFPHWRLEMPGIISSTVLNIFNGHPASDDWVESVFSYRHKIQNGSPYLQLTLENELRPLKNGLKENDQIFFLKEMNTSKYYIFAKQGIVVKDESFVLIDPTRMSADKSKFNIAEISHSYNKSDNILPTNIIYFGAPGTGKSYNIERIFAGIADEKRKERITFHPEFDYISFVGGYKPVSINDESGEERITYKFVPQVFMNIYTRAWNDLDNDYHLAIEEINRGNCAEIFGDLFQLLDRQSDYSITPSEELSKYLSHALSNPDNGLKEGKIQLPKNLFLYATMNTSDQSLFPMDSAFKRRWDWRYIPINYVEINLDGSKNESFYYHVNIGNNKTFRWIDFIREVNAIIRSNPNLGMDKCIGNYFVRPRVGNEISVEEFINKVIFYLWNDVFKDEDNSLFENEVMFEDYYPILDKGAELLNSMITKLDITISENEKTAE